MFHHNVVNVSYKTTSSPFYFSQSKQILLNKTMSSNAFSH